MKNELNYEFKLLSSDDIVTMRELLNLFGDVFNEVDTYCNHQPDTAYLRRLLDKAHFMAIVALNSNKVIGGLAAYELQKFEQARSEIYIYDLAVDEAERRQGVATGLIQTLKKIAAERGAYVVFVQADQGDEPAIALYNKLGIQEEVLHFDIAIKTG
ncbi:AAC(3)-I family aminoglycoside N-acetyltransferase [Aliikangiella coralliicola]|uniref:AAC(3)-I family aminoglycoside N-acetyltransferase n=1 Tax=Aliikangiella coralliicola TaxID=2592383 RepID=A0A545UBV9_9GAMM|nr:AAC(3)-I family aminoglycoside N-acetyltransferase [Aliikangiella coralliicola]TQV86948.1 AAC(3)-I family aminoglycoside N-acetyltransferase [Aliikangiella coralliicola]